MTLYYSLVSLGIRPWPGHATRRLNLHNLTGVPPPRLRDGPLHDVDHPYALHLEEEVVQLHFGKSVSSKITVRDEG